MGQRKHAQGRSNIFLLISGCTIIALAALALWFLWPKDDRLDKAALTQVLSGNTVRGRAEDGRLYHVYFSSTGEAYMQVEDGFNDEGSWRVTSDGYYCSRWQEVRRDMETCFAVRRKGGDLLFLKRSDEDNPNAPMLLMDWLSGNPKQLPKRSF